MTLPIITADQSKSLDWTKFLDSLHWFFIHRMAVIAQVPNHKLLRPGENIDEMVKLGPDKLLTVYTEAKAAHDKILGIVDTIFADEKTAALFVMSYLSDKAPLIASGIETVQTVINDIQDYIDKNL